MIKPSGSTLPYLVAMPKVGTIGKNISWQKPVKAYAADDKVMATLVAAGKRFSHSQAVMGDTKPSNYGMVEIVVKKKNKTSG